MPILNDPVFFTNAAEMEFLRQREFDPSRPRAELYDDFLKLPDAVRDKWQADWYGMLWEEEKRSY